MKSKIRIAVISITFIALTLLLVNVLTEKNNLYYPAMTRVSWLLFFSCLSYYIMVLRVKLLTKIAISIPIALALPIIAGTAATILFDKGSGPLQHIDLHILAYIIFFLLSISLSLILNRISFLSRRKRRS